MASGRKVDDKSEEKKLMIVKAKSGEKVSLEGDITTTFLKYEEQAQDLVENQDVTRDSSVLPPRTAPIESENLVQNYDNSEQDVGESIQKEDGESSKTKQEEAAP